MPRQQAPIAPPLPHPQRGAALIIMLVVVVLGAASILVSALNRPGLSIEREQVTSLALAQAKEALLAYAMNSENDASETQARPGNLPCPDTTAPDLSNTSYGAEETSCVAGAIGRLPWKTLGLPELRDSDGEPLWYAVSENFRRRSIISNTLNSDTAGTLDVYDNTGAGTPLTTSGSRAVAVVFAPGRALGTQVRNTNSDKTTVSNYLESAGTNTSRNNATTGGPFIAAHKTDTFNDRLLFITADQLLSGVERRVGNEIKNLLNTYYTAWGKFPFAVPFSNPSSATYSGSSGTNYGLTPLDALLGGTSSRPAWNATPSIAFSDNVTRLYCALSDGGWTNSRWRCCTDSSDCSSTSNITIPAGVTVTITGRLNSVGHGFWRPHDITTTNEVRVRNSSGSTVLATSLLDNVSVTATLNYSDGGATVVFSATGKSDGSSTLRRVELRDIQSYSSTFPSWFSVNNWQQVMHYAISPGYVPGGTGACSALPATPSCLTISGTGGGTNKRAAVVMTGRALSGQSAHPNGTLSNYLESENVTPADYTYENATRSSSFNDQVTSVAP